MNSKHNSWRTALDPFQPDLALAALLTLSVLALYLRTLVPSVLDGDQGQFQYLPSIPGIPYPPGFPLYMLLGFLWSHLPLGTLAYRMNLLSAIFGALSVGVFYFAVCWAGIHRLARVLAAITLALVPTLWQYSTWASEHALNNLLTVLFIACLIRWQKFQSTRAFLASAFVFGLGLSNHPSFVLFAPATAVLLIVNRRSLLNQPRQLLAAFGLLLLPCLLYLLLPFRGIAFADSPLILPSWSDALARGLVSVYFDPSPAGWIHYFTALSFTGSMVRSLNWNNVLGAWGSTVLNTLNIPILIFAVLGAIQMLRTRERIGLWFGIALLTLGLVTPEYIYTVIGSGSDVNAFLEKFFQPLFVLLIFLEAWGIDLLLRTVSAVPLFNARPYAKIVVALILVALALYSWNELWSKHTNAGTERSLALESKWDIIRRYPPAQNAYFIAHWGDLTPLWYYQTADRWRPDILTVYPPNDDQINTLLARGDTVYLAGAPLDWAPKTLARKHLTPWGPLVQVSQKAIAPASPLSHSTSLTMGDGQPRIKVTGYDLAPSSMRANTLDIALYWQALDRVALDTYLVYFSLSPTSGVDAPDTKSAGDSLAVTWLSGQKLPAGQPALGTYEYPIPSHLHAGEWQVNALIYSTDSAQNLKIQENGATQFSLGTITLDENGNLLSK